MPEITTIAELRLRIPEPNAPTLAKILPALDGQARAFIQRSPMLFMATRDASGNVDVSPKGDASGFAHIEDDTTLLLPERPGNNIALGLQNLLATRSIGLIFVLPGTAETFRVNGEASLHDDHDLLTRLGTQERPALLAIRVRITRCFFHCARAFNRSQLWRHESWDAPQKVSFGKIISPRIGGDDNLAAVIDTIVAKADTENLWRNS
jgi:uncharacterized protein